MFWRVKPQSNRVRLTLVSTLVVAIALGLSFGVVLSVVREQSIKRRFQELERAIDQVPVQRGDSTAMEEADESLPDLVFGLFSLDGKVVESTNSKVPPIILGNKKVGDQILVGKIVGNRIIVVSGSWKETESGLRQIAMVLAILWVPLSLLVAGMTWYGGGLVLRPVQELIHSATALSVADQGRLETRDRGEFAELAVALNDMLDRVRSAAINQEQFASDAAHELRTPLALLRTQIETMLLRQRTLAEYKAGLGHVLEEAERMTAIVETLLQSARSPHEKVASIDIEPRISEVLTRSSSAFKRAGISVNYQGKKAQCKLAPGEIEVIFSNLIDNCLRYCPTGTHVEVELRTVGSNLELIVRDDGLGMSDEDREHAFERFYRGDPARNRETGGAGIGLAVVKKIVASRGGIVEFLKVPIGTTVRVVLPKAETQTLANAV